MIEVAPIPGNIISFSDERATGIETILAVSQSPVFISSFTESSIENAIRSFLGNSNAMNWIYEGGLKLNQKYALKTDELGGVGYAPIDSPTFTGIVTLSASTIIPNGGVIGQTAGPKLTFDDTNNILGISGGSLSLSSLTIIPNGGVIGQASGPKLTFDDTGNILGITDCSVVLNGAARINDRVFTVKSISGYDGIYNEGSYEGPIGSSIYLGNTDELGQRLRFTTNAGTEDCYVDYYINLHFRSGESSSGDKIIFTSAGYLGINDTSPSYYLDVNGTGRFVGNLYADANVGSVSFSSGFTGSGWRLENASGEYTFVVDNLSVRKKMTVYELDINKINSINGGLIISSANATCLTVDGTRIYFDEDGTNKQIQFQVNDYIRAKVWTGRETGDYIGLVTAVHHSATYGEAYIDATTISGTAWDGMELVQIGNNTDTARQNLIYITASDTNNPYIDMLAGVNDGSFAGKQKLRIGNLTGITDAVYGSLSGYGLWADNVYLTGWIKAGSGYVGGFTINSTEGLYAGTGSTRVQMKPGAGFWAGATAFADAPFSVSNAGYMKATSGLIGGWSIETSRLSSTVSGMVYYLASNGDISLRQEICYSYSLRGDYTLTYVPRILVFDDDTDTTLTLPSTGNLPEDPASVITTIVNNNYYGSDWTKPILTISGNGNDIITYGESVSSITVMPGASSTLVWDGRKAKWFIVDPQSYLKNLYVSSTSSFTGSATFNGSVTLNEAVTLNKSVTFNDPTTFNDTVSVSGAYITVDSIQIRPANQHSITAGTSDITCSASEVDMTTMSKSVTPKGTKILVLFAASFYTNASNQTLSLWINIGGSNVRKAKHYLHEGFNEISFHHLESVTPGTTYTVKMRWQGTTQIEQQGSTDSERILTIVDLI